MRRCRLVLPLLPALAASSPIADGIPTGLLDYRLEAYRSICSLTPRVVGRVIPDTVGTRQEYEARILAPMYEEIAPHDAAGVLRHEWLNSRGAIPRFDRDAIEIRLVDVQECPLVDVAIAAAIVAVVQSLYSEQAAALADQQAIRTDRLSHLLLATIRDADEAIVDDVAYLRVLGFERIKMQPPRRVARADRGMRWLARAAWWHAPIETILRRGPLARRILHVVGEDTRRDHLREVYGALCQCLEDGRMFE